MELQGTIHCIATAGGLTSGEGLRRLAQLPLPHAVDGALQPSDLFDQLLGILSLDRDQTVPCRMNPPFERDELLAGHRLAG